jgi:hypothetical protein
MRGTLRIAVLLSLLTVAVVASAVAAAVPEGKQRIAIEGTFDTETGKSTWKLIPLTAGPLIADSGTGQGSGDVKKPHLRNGQSVIPITGDDLLNGKRGSIVLEERVESRSVGRGYSADVGTWTFTGQLGAYAGYRGGGGFAGVGLPNGKLLLRAEGFVSKRS